MFQVSRTRGTTSVSALRKRSARQHIRSANVREGRDDSFEMQTPNYNPCLGFQLTVKLLRCSKSRPIFRPPGSPSRLPAAIEPHRAGLFALFQVGFMRPYPLTAFDIHAVLLHM